MGWREEIATIFPAHPLGWTSLLVAEGAADNYYREIRHNSQYFFQNLFMGEMPQPDPALLELFRAELDTHTATLSAGLLSLEKEPNQPQCVEGLMRAAHSIKGAAKIVGFEAAVKVAHLMEDCFVAAQVGKIQLGSETVDVLLRGLDALERLSVPSVSPAEPSAADEFSLEQLLAQIAAVKFGQPLPAASAEEKAAIPLQASSAAIPLQERSAEKTGNQSPRGEASLHEFVLEAKEHLTGMVDDLLALEKCKDRPDSQCIDRLFRAVHSVKGSAGFFGCRVIESLAHAMEEVLEGLRGQEAAAIESSLIDALLAGNDRTMALIDDIQRSNEADVSEIIQRLNSFCKGDVATILPQAESTAPFAMPAAATASAGDAALASDRAASLRVPVPLVDRLMTLAGELVLTRNQALRSLDDGAAAMRPVLQKLDAVTRELQGAVTQTRMQPVGNLFAKFPRMVRDLARQLNKQIELEMSGTEVELDKSVLEQLSDPLTHLVRNAADHGIEMPAERQKAGKPSLGKISLSASQIGGQIFITIRDDGRGLDPRRIKNKARDAKLRTDEELDCMADRDILGLILLPGFSTAKEVTDVSGRGVGMDVVKTNLDRLGGTLTIDSTPGAGTAFALRVPLTLAIIPCLIISAGGQRYAIPQKDLEELVCVHPDLNATKIETTWDQELVRLRGRLLPLVRLREVFARSRPLDSTDRKEIVKKYHEETFASPSSPADSQSRESLHSTPLTLFAVVKTGSRRFGIVVDDILKSEEIVVKPMHGSLKPLSCYSGATIMGDGQVALILNVEGIANHAGIRFGDIAEERRAVAESAPSESSLLLLFAYGPQEQFAVPLMMIRHLAMVERKQIERIGPHEFVPIAGTPTEIVRLDRYLPVSPESGSDLLFLLLPKNSVRPLGVLATSIIDTETLPANFANDAFRADGVLGTAMVRGRMTIFLDIARLAELTETAPPQTSATTSSPSSKGRILLVEDTQFFQVLVGSYLKGADYEVTTAGNGLEALQLLKAQDFDLVVSDIEMPVMDGWAFAQAVRQNDVWNDMPLLALTTLNSSESRERAKRCGFNGYQVKLDRGEFLTAVAEMLLLRQYRQENSAAEGAS
jgi:two-component system, chemotaxis family, sensor kinase CheA